MEEREDLESSLLFLLIQGISKEKFLYFIYLFIYFLKSFIISQNLQSYVHREFSFDKLNEEKRILYKFINNNIIV